jgi:hypothetical protein
MKSDIANFSGVLPYGAKLDAEAQEVVKALDKLAASPWAPMTVRQNAYDRTLQMQRAGDQKTLTANREWLGYMADRLELPNAD